VKLRPFVAASTAIAVVLGCRGVDARSASTSPLASTTGEAAELVSAPGAVAPQAALPPNELGRIPVLEYHVIGDRNALYERERGQFRRDLEDVYRRGYRPVNLSDVLDRKIDLPAGQSPVVFVFDDASPSQFRYIEKDGKLEVDPSSGLGIWQEFQRTHRDWPNKGVFCLLNGAAAGHNFFGDKGIEGQKTEWRFRKVQYLHQLGFELCGHTVWHAKLNKFSDAVVQEQIARNVMAIDSAVPGYRVRSFALPYGLWPKNRPLAWAGEWTDPKTHRTVRYAFDGVMEVAGGPTRSPFDPQFNPHSITRIEAIGDDIRKRLDQLDQSGSRYVSDGNPNTVARPQPRVATVKR
jgi:hypothetical protein